MNNNNLIGKDLGKYKIVGFLGRGAMGAVYKADLVSLGIPVAFKVMEGARDELARTRFDREAKLTLGMPKHENVVYVYDAGIMGSIRFIAMELVEGVDLDRAVANQQLTDNLEKAWAVSEACKGLDFIHEQGLIHRDIKPHNIIIDGSGKVKITDFGIAETGATDKLLSEGRGAGTPRYMAPEIIKEAGSGDARSDVYSMGLVLYEMIVGSKFFNKLFAAPDYKAVLRKVVAMQIPSLRSVKKGIHHRLDEIVMKAIEKDPTRRYQTAGDFGADLEKFVLIEKGEYEEPEQAQLRPYLVVVLCFELLVLCFLLYLNFLT